MQVDPQQLVDNGFIIMKECVPSYQLDELRNSFEELVERQKSIWASDRNPTDPPGGFWGISAQPRLSFSTLIDSTTANAIEFCLHENTLGVSSQVMRDSKTVLKYITMMCNPVRDHGPAGWHWDIEPYRDGPLCGLQADMRANGIGTVQWNIAMYEDDVLWIVPGSHIRPNTETENQQLLDNPRAPIEGSIPVKLEAGDGVVYSNAILHWGSNYSAKLRRTIHLAFRPFNGSKYSYRPYINWNSDFVKHLSPWTQKTFEGFSSQVREEFDTVGWTFRAVVDKDVQGFLDGLATLHPVEEQRMVCVMLLTKLAYKVHILNRPDVSQLSDASARAGAIAWPLDSLYLLEEIAQQFSVNESDTLWSRFVPMENRLKSDEDQYIPGFQTGPTKYFFNDMPANYNLGNFMVAWNI